VLRGIGLGLAAVGQFDRGIEFLLHARAIFKEFSPAEDGGTVGSLIQFYTYLRKFSDALALEPEALALAEGDLVDESGTRVDIGNVYRNRGRFEGSRADFDKALEYYAHADARASQITDPADRDSERYSIFANVGNTELWLERFDSARQHLEQARSLAQFGPRFDPSMYRDLGYANEKLGNDQEALSFYHKSIEVGEQLRQASGLEDFRVGIGALYAPSYGRAASLLVRLGQDAEAFDLSERARAQTFLDLLSSKRVDIGETADNELAERERALRNELAELQREGEKRVGSYEDEIQKKQQEYTDLLTQLQLANPEYHSLVTGESLTLRDVQERLDDQTTLLSYIVTEQGSLAFIVSRTSLEVVPLEIGEIPLHDAIQALRDSGALRSDQPEGIQDLYDWLVRPVLPFLTTPIVGIIPFGDLHYLPFAALTDGQQFFGDSHVLFYLPSASALPFIQERRKEAAGAVLPISYGLKYGKEEAEVIGKIYRTEPELEDNATESLLRAQAGGSAILHVAAHGNLSEVTPLFSRVQLAPDQDNDGDLVVHEVYGLDLHATNMVVLSACQTQLGVRQGGDDLVGLTRAFVYAGTPTVVASLWKVDDEATSVFMEHFYKALQDGETKAGALQTAQRRTREEYPQPYYWAAFVLTGDPGPVAVELGSEGGGGLPLVWLAAGAAVVSILGVAGAWRWRGLRSRSSQATDPATSAEADR